MYWRLEKSLIETTVQTFRRVFQYAPPWVNKDLEIVQVGSGSSGIIFEQFNEEAEKYPRITVGGAGGTHTHSAFNDLFGVFDNDYYVLGSRTIQWVKVTGSDILEVPISLANIVGQTVRGVFTSMAWTGQDFGNSALHATLYKTYTTTPTAVSSGSFPNVVNTSLGETYASLYPDTLLSDRDYWLMYNTPTGSSYYIAVDPYADGLYKFQGNSYSGSVVAKLLFPGFERIGGLFTGSLQVLCQAKNDSSSPRNFAEIISQYFTYLKHASISRSSTNDAMLLSSDIGEWLAKGVRIVTIREGPLVTRRRAENDVIYSVTVSIDYLTEYFEDFIFSELKEIDVTSITNFWAGIKQ